MGDEEIVVVREHAFIKNEQELQPSSVPRPLMECGYPQGRSTRGPLLHVIDEHRSIVFRTVTAIIAIDHNGHSSAVSNAIRGSCHVTLVTPVRSVEGGISRWVPGVVRHLPHALPRESRNTRWVRCLHTVGGAGSNLDSHFIIFFSCRDARERSPQPYECPSRGCASAVKPTNAAAASAAEPAPRTLRRDGLSTNLDLLFVITHVLLSYSSSTKYPQ